MVQVKFILCIGLWSVLQPISSLSFSPISSKHTAFHASLSKQSLVALRSSNDETSAEQGDASPPQQAPSPPAVPKKRLDPLMASLTRTDPETANGPTQNIPIFGEVPVGGGLVVLVPAAVIGFLGIVLSIVVAVQSSDLIVDSLNQVADDISQTASSKNNAVYDESVCRGLCSPQDDDLEGLKKFMESLRKD